MLQNQDVMVEIVEKAGEEAQDFKDKMLSLWENKYAEDAPDGFEEFMARIGVEHEEEKEEQEN
jgi:ribosome assembly protein YihI (activator of Der GTPase)